MFSSVNFNTILGNYVKIWKKMLRDGENSKFYLRYGRLIDNKTFLFNSICILNNAH